MALQIDGKDLFDQDGNWLKSINCPKLAQKKDLITHSDRNYTCSLCEETIYNTDHMTKKAIVGLLKKNPDACLSINLMNPVFNKVR